MTCRRAPVFVATSWGGLEWQCLDRNRLSTSKGLTRSKDGLAKRWTYGLRPMAAKLPKGWNEAKHPVHPRTSSAASARSRGRANGSGPAHPDVTSLFRRLSGRARIQAGRIKQLNVRESLASRFVKEQSVFISRPDRIGPQQSWAANLKKRSAWPTGSNNRAFTHHGLLNIQPVMLAEHSTDKLPQFIHGIKCRSRMFRHVDKPSVARSFALASTIGVVSHWNNTEIAPAMLADSMVGAIGAGLQKR